MYSKLKIIVPAAIFIVFALSQYFQWLLPVNNLINDNIMTSRRAAHENIIIVGIDERSINEIGVWPWPRSFMAETVFQLSEMGAAVIGINVLYSTAGAVPEYDQMLVEAAAVADSRLVLGGAGDPSRFQEDPDFIEIDHFELPFDELERLVNVGFLNVIEDGDGIMRRAVTAFRFGDVTVNSLPFEIYRTYRQIMGQTALTLADIPLDDNGQFPIRYVGGPNSFTTISLWGVINGHYPAAMFENSIVLVGSFAHGTGESTFTTPMERNIPTHAIELYANIIQNFLEGVFLTEAGWVLNLAIFAIVAIIFILVLQKLKPATAIILTFSLIAITLFGGRLVYSQLHTILSIGDIVIFLGISYIAYLVVSIVAAQNDKQEIKNLFGRFVAPEVVEQIVSGGVDIQLGGVVKEISALFVDIRGFTAFSEANPPEKVVDMVNRYLELTSTSIQQNRGTIDKFIGDATMALFNAPNDVPNHALCAVRAAWAMKQGAISLQAEIMEEYGVDLQFGIGINTGSAVVGNMGSDFRMDYTAIGDAINTAARLESSATKGQIVISDATYQEVKDYVEVVELGEMSFKNKSVGVLVYSVENVIEGRR